MKKLIELTMVPVQWAGIGIVLLMLVTILNYRAGRVCAVAKTVTNVNLYVPTAIRK